MDNDDLAGAADRVRALLKEARTIAWEAFDPPAEGTVIALFQQLCLERDYVAETLMDAPGDGRVLH